MGVLGLTHPLHMGMKVESDVLWICEAEVHITDTICQSLFPFTASALYKPARFGYEPNT